LLENNNKNYNYKADQSYKMRSAFFYSLLCVLALHGVINSFWHSKMVEEETMPLQVNATTGDDGGDKRASVTNPTGAYLAAKTALASGNYYRAEELLLEALNYTENRDVALYAVRVMLKNGSIDNAVSLIEKYNLHEGSDASRLAVIAKALKEGDKEAALTNTKLLSGTGIARVLAPIISAWIQNDTHNSSANIQLKDLATQKHVQATALYHLGLMQMNTNKLDEALVSMRDSFKASEYGSQRVAEVFAKMLADAGGKMAAAKTIDNFEKASGNNWFVPIAREQLKANGKLEANIPANASQGVAELLYNLSSLVYDADASEDAHILLSLSIYLWPENTNARLVQGFFFEADNNFKSALNAYNSLSDNSSYAYKASMQKAYILGQMNRTDEAINELDKSATKWLNISTTYSLKGDVLRSKGRFAEAITAYTKAIDLSEIHDGEKASWNLYYYRGISNERIGKMDVAETDFKQALSISIDNPEVLNYLSYSWLERGIKYHEALANLEKAYAQKPYEAQIADSYAWALFKNNMYEEAVVHLEKALRLSPDDPFINDHLGDAYWKVGRVNEARFQWSKALNYNPDTELARNLGDKLKTGLGEAVAAEVEAEPVSQSALAE